MARSVNCPSCRRPLELPDDLPPGPLNCPSCQGAIDFPAASPEASEEAPPRFSRGTRILTVLIGINCAAIFAVGLLGFAQHHRDYWIIGVAMQWLALFALLDLLVIILLARKVFPAVTRALEDPESPRQARLKLSQILIGIIVMLVVAVAVIAFFFATCAGMISLLEYAR